MKVIKAINIETAHVMFKLTIPASADGKGYVGEYSGTAPKFGQVVRPGAPIPLMRDEGSGKLWNANIDALIAACRAQIEKDYGKIERTFERNV